MKKISTLNMFAFTPQAIQENAIITLDASTPYWWLCPTIICEEAKKNLLHRQKHVCKTANEFNDTSIAKSFLQRHNLVGSCNMQTWSRRLPV